MLVPATGATLSGTAATLDASASNATSVEFWVAGGSYGYGKMIGTATSTPYGWYFSWNTTTAPNGSYVLLSEGFGAGGSAFSAGVNITVANANANWPQDSYGPDRTGYQPNETKIGTANVGTLSKVRTYQAPGGGESPPLIANGVVFATDGNGVQAFDAAGSMSCTGTPKVCKPLWQTSTNTGSGPAFSPGPGSPVVANGVLYVPGDGNGGVPSLGGTYVAAFDAAGSNGCTVYSGIGNICVPMWTTTGPAGTENAGSPTIADGVLFIANGTLLAFDAAGSRSCTRTPKVCSPLWTGTTSSYGTSAAPSVANGTVYVASKDGKLYAFDAGGTTNCSVAVGETTCTPLWTATTPISIYGTPAVANGTVYTLSANGMLSAFAANGSTNCSGAMLSRTCTPLWASAPGGSGYDTESPTAIANANGVVYFASTSATVYGFDAASSTNCSVTGGTTTCPPLWSANPSTYADTAVVANGVVYFTGSGVVWAYSL